MRREDLREGLLVSHGLRVGLLVWKRWFMAALLVPRMVGFVFDSGGEEGDQNSYARDGSGISQINFRKKRHFDP